MESKIITTAIPLLFTLIFLANVASASYISGNIYVSSNGEARFNIETDKQINIQGLTFNNEKLTGRTNQLVSLQGGAEGESKEED